MSDDNYTARAQRAGAGVDEHADQRVVPADMDSAGNLWYAWRLGTGELGDARTVSTTTAVGA